jgi:solute carrier family 13 (sodium-dependent dicarboxylate transporter), member 2/3/5
VEIAESNAIKEGLKSGYPLKHMSGLVLGLLAAVAIWFSPLAVDAHAKHALAITALMVIFWMFEPVDHGITALLGCYLFWAFGVAKFSVAFAGFADNTPWFLFGALIMGEAASSSGLATRIGYIFMGLVGTSYARLLISIILLVLVLNFFVPSGMAQLAILAPIVMGVVAAFGLDKKSNVGRGMFLTLTYTCGLFNKMILAGGATVLTRGIVEKLTGHSIPYGLYVLAYLPAILITVFATWLIVVWLYPPEKSHLPADSAYLQHRKLAFQPWTKAEKKTMLVLMVAVALWVTDFWNKIDPAVVALGAGLVLTLPGIGVVSGKQVRQTNFLLIIFMGGALSMGVVLVHTNALDVITGSAMSWMTPLLGNSFQSSSTLYWGGFLYHFALGSELSMLSTALPVLIHYAQGHGFNPTAFAMTWAFASGGKLFVYQSAVLIQGFAYGFFDGKDMFKVGLALTVVEGLLLWFLVPVYWPLIGLSWTS